MRRITRECALKCNESEIILRNYILSLFLWTFAAVTLLLWSIFNLHDLRIVGCTYGAKVYIKYGTSLEDAHCTPPWSVNVQVQLPLTGHNILALFRTYEITNTYRTLGLKI